MEESKSLVSKLKKKSIKPSMAWCLVFFPALMYYSWTRLHSLGLFSASSYGTATEASLVDVPDCQILKESSVVYYNHRNCQVSSPFPLRYALYLVRDDFRDVVATTWKYDEELGRGFLLISTSYQTGKVWQWETGGGPIPIGKTLSIIHSGCRSNLYHNCTAEPAVGSGGLIVDTIHEPQKIIIAEWGEGRIVRLEENGARTPLIIQVPAGTPLTHAATEFEEEEEKETSATEFEESSTTSTRRLVRPSQLLLTPFADLLVLEKNEDKGDFLWQLSQIHKIPGLQSLPDSRRAHAWGHLNYSSPTRGITTGVVSTSGATAESKDGMPQKLLQSPHLGGMALVPKEWLQLYVSMKQGDSVVIVLLSLEENDEDDDVYEEENATKKASKSERQSSIFLNYSKYAAKPGPIEVDEKGNMYLVVDGGILMVSSKGSILGKISIPDLSIVDMTLGEDRFLYLATETKLYRLRLRNKNLKVPTDMVKQK